jgi:hypothetical protein
MKHLRLLFLSMLFLPIGVIAQDSIAPVEQAETEYIEQAFYGTRVLNGHSIETTPRGQLDLRLQHRMGRLDQGAYDLFGLDQASFRFGLEYGVTGWLMVGLGRSTLEKYYDGFVKAKILRQSKGKHNMPLSLLAYAGMGINSTHWADDSRKNYFSSRLTYTYQLIIGRKLWDRVGIQLAPTLIHRNLVASSKDHNDVFALGFGGRVRFSNRAAFSIEYYWVPKGQIYSQYNGADVTNNLSAGFEIFTRQHVFQIFVSNGIGMTERQFISQNTEKLRFKTLHIGLNITRLFRLVEY